MNDCSVLVDAITTREISDVAKIRALSALGLNITQISDRTGISPRRVSNLAKLDGLVLPGTVQDREQRDKRIRQLARHGSTSFEIARDVGLTPQRVRYICRKLGIEIVADVTNLGLRRRFDSRRVVEATVERVDGIGSLLDQVRVEALPRDEISGWIDVLDEAIVALAQLRKRLKESQL